ncbi:nuclear division protein [Saccharomyces pastorianus]|uniref:Nuclear division protein n=1 Tax=Saccharomyces pastorianus TaxID=27292 RepID=A0A6C1E7H7_SACPS|nr:nuclear division protein [Saccharomyces pastorianus]
MSYKANQPSPGEMPKRSPSILVTDARSSKNRISAPFAGHAAGSRKSMENKNVERSQGIRSSNVGPSPMMKPAHSRRRSSGRFSDISIDNILSDNSEIPSARREERLSSSSSDRPRYYERLNSRRKMINPLPPRTSKTSQKLVLIPEEDDLNQFRNTPHNALDRQRPKVVSMKSSSHDRLPRHLRENPMARITAYNVADGFNLNLLYRFLEETHEVSPRLYDECLYVAYTLPLLPGKGGFRIKSNISKKTVGGKTLIDNLIDTSEQRDHHYEYYSGVETVEDANNNYELETNGGNNSTSQDTVTVPDHLPNPVGQQDSFNPMEPQFFAEETPLELEKRERIERMNMLKKEENDADDNGNSNSINDDDDDTENYVLEGTDQYLKSSRSQPSSASSAYTPSPPSSARRDSNRGYEMQKDNEHEGNDRHAEIFIFHYGVIVFWNFTEIQEKNILGDITFADYKNLMIRPLDEQDIETEQFHFEYDRDTERPRIFNDIVTLRSGDHIIELTLSHAIAQSSKLSRFESRISPILISVTKLPKRLALYGTLGLKREQLLKKSGKLFKLRVDVNLSSTILDTPEFFWSFEPSLHPLYVAMREYLEIDQRVQVLNDRCKVFLEFFDICVDSVAERNMARVTWWFILVILFGVIFSLAEIFVRYIIIHRHSTK